MLRWFGVYIRVLKIIFFLQIQQPVALKERDLASTKKVVTELATKTVHVHFDARTHKKTVEEAIDEVRMLTNRTAPSRPPNPMFTYVRGRMIYLTKLGRQLFSE